MFKRLGRYLASLIMLLPVSVWPARAVQMPPGIHSCASHAACLKLLDRVAPTAGPGMGPEENEIREILQQIKQFPDGGCDGCGV